MGWGVLDVGAGSPQKNRHERKVLVSRIYQPNLFLKILTAKTQKKMSSKKVRAREAPKNFFDLFFSRKKMAAEKSFIAKNWNPQNP